MLRFLTSFLLMLAITTPGISFAEEEYWEYTFKPGDSIWKIAKKYTTSVNNWVKINKINSIRQGPDRKIRPGTRIVIPVSMLKKQPTPAIVLSISGGATLVRPNGNERKLAAGDKLYAGDKVITKEKQRLLMQFADESELQVLANSEVVLDQISYHKDTGMADTRIRLNIGSVNTSVKKQKSDSHYEIRTPASVTAVRGTAFRLSTGADAISRTEVTEGIVNVSAGEAEQNVKQQYGIIAEKDKPLPPPVKLLDAPESKIKVNKNEGEMLASWRALNGAEYYRYELSRDDKFNDIVVASTTKENKVDVASLDPGQYYFRVSGVHENKLQGLNSVSPFEMPKYEGVPWVVYGTIAIMLLSL